MLLLMVLADIIMKNTASMSGSGGNANAALNLLIALMLFVVTELPEENQNMVELYNLITLTNPKVLDAIFDGLDATHPAKKPYLIYAQSSENFRSNITADVATRLLVYAQEGVQSISIHDEIDLTLPGTKKCAYFIITPDRTLRMISWLHYFKRSLIISSSNMQMIKQKVESYQSKCRCC